MQKCGGTSLPASVFCIQHGTNCEFHFSSSVSYSTHSLSCCLLCSTCFLKLHLFALVISVIIVVFSLFHNRRPATLMYNASACRQTGEQVRPLYDYDHDFRWVVWKTGYHSLKSVTGCIIDRKIALRVIRLPALRICGCDLIGLLTERAVLKLEALSSEIERFDAEDLLPSHDSRSTILLCTAIQD